MKPPILTALALAAVLSGCDTRDSSRAEAPPTPANAQQAPERDHETRGPAALLSAPPRDIPWLDRQQASTEGNSLSPAPSGYGPDPPEVQEEDYEVEPKTLANAFEAATGHRAPFTTNSKFDTIRTSPLKLVQLPFGPVLLTQDENGHGHASRGAIGIYYLKEAKGKFHVTSRWPRAVEGWGWGEPPGWRMTNRFTAYPAIYAWGHYMAQGTIIKSATLTELRPAGPSTSDLIGTSYDDEGGRMEDDDRVCTVNGRITNIRKDRSFDVLVTGSVRTVDRYVKRNGRFVATKRIRWNVPCGYRTPPED
jgi:hypothetical protein